MSPTPLSPISCFVGMFDVLGFKALRAIKGTAGLHQQYVRGILPAIAHSAAGKGKVAVVDGHSQFVPDFSGSKVKYRAISDSVLFFTSDDSFDSFFSIVHSAFMLLQFGFSGGKAPFRGAIGWGDLIDDPVGILIGSAIEDAYNGESMQAWAGAMLTQAARDFAQTNRYIESFAAVHETDAQAATDDRAKRTLVENARRLVRYSVPTQQNTKDGPVVYGQFDTFVVDWTIRMYNDASSKSFDPSSSAHAATIARNTRDFERWARQR